MAKLSIEKKTKLIYSGELILFSVIFLVLGVLELVKIITLSDRFQLIFKILTLIGASWLVIDFIWMMLSKKRKERNSFMDKVMMLPLAAYLYGFDIAGFIYPRTYEYYQIGVSIAFFYIACAYLFQGIYHYHKPIPMIIEAIEEEEKKLLEEAEAKEKSQENVTEEKSDE